MVKFIKGASVAVLMALTASAVSPMAVAQQQDDGSAALLLLLFTTTIYASVPRHYYDASKAQSLVDQAYAGQGEKLELLANSSKKAVEDVADAIVALDKAGKLDASKPEQMAQTIAAAIK